LLSDHLGYAQVFIDCSSESALITNNKRPNPVDTKTIVTMATKMEPPSAVKYAWEIHSMNLVRSELLESQPFIL